MQLINCIDKDDSDRLNMDKLYTKQFKVTLYKHQSKKSKYISLNQNIEIRCKYKS